MEVLFIMVLRLILKQTQANYRIPETIDNVMTYRLPPPSTVRGAIASAIKELSQEELLNIKIGIQGTYETQASGFKMTNVFLNHVEPDRGILIKAPNNTFSNAYVKVLDMSKSKGVNFNKTLAGCIVNDKKLFDEYMDLKNQNKKIAEKLKIAKMDKNKEQIKSINNEKEQNKLKLSQYMTLIKMPREIEILHGIKLIIHLQAEDDVILKIKDSINNLTCIGRSEDFIDLVSCSIVNRYDMKIESTKNLHYINQEYINRNIISINSDKLRGTVYNLNDKYEIIDNKRIFSKVKALLCSNIKILECSKNVFSDGEYIVCLFD